MVEEIPNLNDGLNDRFVRMFKISGAAALQAPCGYGRTTYVLQRLLPCLQKEGFETRYVPVAAAGEAWPKALRLLFEIAPAITCQGKNGRVALIPAEPVNIRTTTGVGFCSGSKPSQQCLATNRWR